MTWHPSTIRWLIAILVVSLILLAINLPTTPEKPSPSGTPENQALGQGPAQQQQPPYEVTLPYWRADNEYAGSASCRECQTDEHKSWLQNQRRNYPFHSPDRRDPAFEEIQSVLYVCSCSAKMPEETTMPGCLGVGISPQSEPGILNRPLR